MKTPKLKMSGTAICGTWALLMCIVRIINFDAWLRPVFERKEIIISLIWTFTILPWLMLIHSLWLAVTILRFARRERAAPQTPP